MDAFNRTISRAAPLAPVVIRVIVGVIMAAHGWQKLTEMGPANFGSGMLDGLGVPAPVVFGYIVTFTELIGGIMLIVGFLTRFAAAALTAILAVATLLVKTDIGFLSPAGANLPGAELDLALIAGLVGLILLGAGRPSVDHALGFETGTPHVDDVAVHSGGAATRA